MPVSQWDMFAIKKSSSLALSHSTQLCFRNRKGLGRDSDLFFALHHQKISHGGWFWTEDTGDWSAACCGREAVSSSCQENFAIPHLLLPSEYSGDSRKVWCHWHLGFPYCPETGSTGEGREPTCEGGSNALQNRLEIQTYIQEQTTWRGKTLYLVFSSSNYHSSFSIPAARSIRWRYHARVWEQWSYRGLCKFVSMQTILAAWTSSHGNPVIQPPSLGWLTSGWPIAQTNS